jgi:hypothetical protein
MAKRLGDLQPFGDTIPQFNGTKCIERPDKLTATEVEGLMRTAVFMARGSPSQDVTLSWRELGKAGVHLWKENC